MQHTTKYQFNLIETSDAFSPEALNANTEAVETELARVETETAAQIAAGDSAVRAEFAAADAADKSELQSSINGQIASTNSSLSSLQSTVTSLKTALGSGGSNARIYTGSYKGTGAVSYTRTLSFPFQPYVVIVGCAENANSDPWPTVMIRGSTATHSDTHSYAITVTWSASSVSWTTPVVNNLTAAHINNRADTTYYYVAIGA